MVRSQKYTADSMKHPKARRLCLLLGIAVASGGILGLVFGYHTAISYFKKDPTLCMSSTGMCL